MVLQWTTISSTENFAEKANNKKERVHMWKM